MKKSLAFIGLLFFVLTRLQAYEMRNLLQHSATESQVRQSLVMDRKWVPYPAYSDREGWDKFLGNYKSTIIKSGEKYLDYHWRVVRASEYLEYEKSGSRKIMENPNNSNAIAFSAMLMAEFAEGKGRFINDLMNGVFYFSEMTSWAESAHLMAYQKTKRSLPDHREQILELHQGGMAQMLSWTYYFLKPQFDAIDPVIAIRLRDELQKRELDPYLRRDDFWWMATNYKPGRMVNNWNPWCNSNALFCFMLLEDDPDVLTKAICKSMRSVDQYLNYVKSDGACEEGPSYWGHAAGKLYDYLSALRMITGGKINLFTNQQVKAMGEYIVHSYIGDEWVVNFADAAARAVEVNTPLIYRYGMAVNSTPMKAMAAMRERMYPTKLPSKWMDLYIGLETLRFLPLLQAETAVYKPADFTWYPQTEFCYMRSGKAFLAAKGGFNDESHNHNDVGTFIFAYNNTPLLVDAGVGTYTRKTFSSERYSIWTMQSNYHNLPLINGVAQPHGAGYKASGVKVDRRKQTFAANIATAYPVEAQVAKWVRGYKLKKNGLIVTDDFVLNKAKAPNQINFLTWGDVDITTNGVVKIVAKGVSAHLKYDDTTFRPSIEKIELSDPRLSNVWGKSLYRVTLTAKKMPSTGNYKYEIQVVK